jgi:teichuronic acid biosynthesis glycosyltransferase TuaC
VAAVWCSAGMAGQNRSSTTGPRRSVPGRSLSVLTVTNMWPRPDRTHYGTFVASQMRSVAEAGVDLRVHVIDARTNKLAYVRGALSMLGLNFGRRRYDLIHAHTGHCGVLARLQWRYPVLTSYVGYDLYGKPRAGGGITLKSRIEAALFRLTAPLMSATITKSAAMERLLPARARAKNTVLPNGVDFDRFRPMSRSDSRRRLGWPEDEPAALWVGNPQLPRKRLELAERVIEVARERVPDLSLRVCWDADPDEIPVWMNAADALLFTSQAEGSPNVVKEAMACNLPIVTVAVGDTAEVVDGARHCRVLTTDDPAALREALLACLEASPERSDGRERIGGLELTAVAGRLIEIYAATA